MQYILLSIFSSVLVLGIILIVIANAYKFRRRKNFDYASFIDHKYGITNSQKVFQLVCDIKKILMVDIEKIENAIKE